MQSFEYNPCGRVFFGAGAIDQLGPVIAAQPSGQVLLVTDPGVRATGLVDTAAAAAAATGARVAVFDEVEANPTTHHVEAGRAFAAAGIPDLIVAVGGGSAMDCAKGINFLLTNGGVMEDYWGLDKATQPMLPSIGIPTTAGTGSEAQSYALIAQADSHRKMACGDRKARFGTVILDPDTLTSVPPAVAATSGLDAVAHALETYVSTRRNPMSQLFSREAWRLLDANLEPYLADPDQEPSRAGMMLGAFLAGQAIEASMLGAAHACANPLSAGFGVDHGASVALMLPHVVRFNGGASGAEYDGLVPGADAEALASRVEALRTTAGLPARLREIGIQRQALAGLARSATEEWTGQFNPRLVNQTEFLHLYNAAY